MTPEEKFNQEVWWILQQLKYLKISSRGELVKFVIKIRPIPESDALPVDAQEKALLKVEEFGGIKIIEEKTGDYWYGKDYIFIIKFLEPKFDEIYETYKRSCDVNAWANANQEKNTQNLKSGKNIDEGVPEFLEVEKNLQLSTVQPIISNLSADFDTTRKAQVAALKNMITEEDLIEKISGRVQENISGEKTKQQSEQEFSKFIVSVKDREIWISNYLISKPHAVGSNFEFFEHIRLQKPNTKIDRETLPDFGGNVSLKEQAKNKSFIKMLNELGFKGEILKAFFYKRSKDSLIYRGDEITKEDLEKTGIKISLFLKELELAHIKNSPE